MAEKHRIFFVLNEYVGIGILSRIMMEFEQVPMATGYEEDIAFFLSLTKEETETLHDMFDWAIVCMMDFDQKEAEGNYV